MSRIAAPARWASAMPSPSAPGGLVERRYSAPAPPVASIVIGARTRCSSSWPSSQAPSQASPSVARPITAVCSTTWMFSSAVTRSISVSAIAAPVAAPPAWRIRRRLWPPSRPSAYVPSGAVSKPTPSDARCAIRLGPSSTSVRTAAGSHRPRPTRSVSSRCCCGRVVRADRGGDAALREERVRRAQRALGDEHHPRAALARANGCVESGDAGSGDQEVGGSPCFGHGPANNSSSD